MRGALRGRPVARIPGLLGGRVAAWGIVLAILSTACAGGPPVYRPPAYGSEPGPEAPSDPGTGTGPSLAVGLPEDRRPPHHREGLSSHLAEYGGWTGEAVTRDAVWDDPPPEMVAEALAARLRATGRFSEVRVGSQAGSDLVLEWRLRRLRGWEGYHVRKEEPPKVLDALGEAYFDRVRIRDPESGRVVFDGQAGASLDAAGDVAIDPYALAREAMERALDDLAEAVAAADLDRDLPLEVHLQGSGGADDLLEGLPEPWVGGHAGDGVPYGWEGAPRCRRLALEDPSRRYFHPHLGAYSPFLDLWICPADWSGRLRLSGDDAVRFPALVLGIDDRGRAVLVRTLGQSSWPDAGREIADFLELEPVPPQVMGLPVGSP